jgi:hypothetical protein
MDLSYSPEDLAFRDSFSLRGAGIGRIVWHGTVLVAMANISAATDCPHAALA